MKKLLLLVTCIIALSGCAPKITDFVDYNQKSMLLSLGMDKPLVMQTLGTPRRTEVNSDRERWIYWNKAIYGYTVIDNENLATDRLVVTFVDGKVVKWGQQTFADDAMEASQKTMQSAMEVMKTAPKK